MTTVVTAAVGLAAGLHGALYGAYKDSPHESFLLRRFLREIAIALTVSLGLATLYPAARSQSAFVLYLSVFALTRIVTEFWKLFVRVEPQEEFRIPTQIHCVTGVVHAQPAPASDVGIRIPRIHLRHRCAGHDRP